MPVLAVMTVGPPPPPPSRSAREGGAQVSRMLMHNAQLETGAEEGANRKKKRTSQVRDPPGARAHSERGEGGNEKGTTSRTLQAEGWKNTTQTETEKTWNEQRRMPQSSRTRAHTQARFVLMLPPLLLLLLPLLLLHISSSSSPASPPISSPSSLSCPPPPRAFRQARERRAQRKNNNKRRPQAAKPKIVCRQSVNTRLPVIPPQPPSPLPSPFRRPLRVLRSEGGGH